MSYEANLTDVVFSKDPIDIMDFITDHRERIDAQIGVSVLAMLDSTKGNICLFTYLEEDTLHIIGRVTKDKDSTEDDYSLVKTSLNLLNERIIQEYIYILATDAPTNDIAARTISIAVKALFVYAQKKMSNYDPLKQIDNAAKRN
jgi:hypothetical protein